MGGHLAAAAPRPLDGRRDVRLGSGLPDRALRRRDRVAPRRARRLEAVSLRDEHPAQACWAMVACAGDRRDQSRPVRQRAAAGRRARSRALLVLGADGPLGRDEFIRVLDGARTSLEIAHRRRADRAPDRRPGRRRRRVLRRRNRRGRLPVHRDGDGLPAAPLPRLRDREAQPDAARRLDTAGSCRPAVFAERAPDRRVHVVLSDPARPRPARDACATRSSSRQPT